MRSTTGDARPAASGLMSSAAFTVSSTIPGDGDPEQAVISDSPAPTKTANARRLVNMLVFLRRPISALSLTHRYNPQSHSAKRNTPVGARADVAEGAAFSGESAGFAHRPSPLLRASSTAPRRRWQRRG